MPLMQPSPRIAKPFHNARDDLWYMNEPGFAGSDRASLVRSYRLLESDLAETFKTIEPDDRNLEAFGIRLYEILFRACTEIETYCKSILRANGADDPSNGWNRIHYAKLATPLRLGEYSVRVPSWTSTTPSSASGSKKLGFRPFDGWGDESKAPDWWSAYNSVKHDRSEKLDNATLGRATVSVAACQILLYAQFGAHSFGGITDAFGDLVAGPDGFAFGDGIFDLQAPKWPEAEKYGFAFDPEQGHHITFTHLPGGW